MGFGNERPANYRTEEPKSTAASYSNFGFRTTLFKDSKSSTTEDTIVDVVDPIWTTENLNIDKTNQQVTVDLQVTDKYLNASKLTPDDITVYVDGEESYVNKELSKGKLLTETRTIDGVDTEVQYGVKYTLTLTNWQEVVRQKGKIYKEWSGETKIEIAKGTAVDQFGNTSEKQEFNIGHIDFTKPEFTYIYAGTSRDETPNENPEIDYGNKKLTVVFSVADKYFDSSKTLEDCLKVEDLEILIDGEIPIWKAKDSTDTEPGVIRTLTGEVITEQRTKEDGTTEIVTIGYKYTLELKELEQDVIANGKSYLDYSGVVTVGIPAEKFADTSGNKNDGQTITIGINDPGIYTNPYIPTGYIQVEGTDLDTGLTIQDSFGNQYVWIEVPKVKQVYQTAGLEITEFTDSDYTKIENDLHAYTSTYRNGTAYTDTYSGDDASTGLTEELYNELKQKMLKSVYQNGGFYVGKYETGTNTARTSGSSTTDPTQTPVIKQNAYPYTYVTCSQAQTLSSKFAEELDGYTSNLIFGVQWDLVLKYLETKGTTQYKLNLDSTNWGNYKNNLWNITNTSSKYNKYDEDNTKYLGWKSGAYGEKAANADILLSTGASDTFSKQEIYDLAGNVYEWTLEYSSGSSAPCVHRGGASNVLRK